jgi:hypothetical protein
MDCSSSQISDDRTADLPRDLAISPLPLILAIDQRAASRVAPITVRTLQMSKLPIVLDLPWISTPTPPIARPLG